MRLQLTRMKKTAAPSPSLQALLAAALALPGFAQAAARDESTSVSVRLSRYAEDPLAASTSFDGREAERYDIKVGQARVALPLGEDYAAELTAAYETMSGASPWFVQPGADGKPLQVMSGATIDDARTDLALRLSRYADSDVLAVTAGVSKENDYLSVNGGVEWLHELDDQHSSFNLGAAYASDRIDPTDGDAGEAFESRPDDEKKTSVTVTAGFSTIINRRSQVQTALSVTRHEGFLSDPYKLAVVDGSAVQDVRPIERTLASWTTRYRYRFVKLRASTHADYRYFRDQWEVNAHSLSLAWYQDVGERWQFSPSLRYYSQSQAYFYAPFYSTARADGLRSSDYRLSPYGALTYGLGARYRVGEFELSLNAERYQSSGSLALGDVVVENPGLVDFSIASLGLGYKF